MSGAPLRLNTDAEQLPPRPDSASPRYAQSTLPPAGAGADSSGVLFSAPASPVERPHNPRVEPVASVAAPAVTAAPMVEPLGDLAALCQLCHHATASVECVACRLRLCTELGCDALLHSGQALQAHVRASILGTAAPAGQVTPSPPLVLGLLRPCALCRLAEAGAHCDACAMDLCTEAHCDAELHSARALQAHVRRPIDSAAAAPAASAAATAAAVSIVVPPCAQHPCGLCRLAEATARCDTCALDLCTENHCDAELHSAAALRSHQRRPRGSTRHPSRAGSRRATASTSSSGVVGASLPAAVAPIPPPLAAPLCGLCTGATATVRCDMCQIDLCIEHGCDQQLHLAAATLSHIRRKIGEPLPPDSPAPSVAPAPAPLAATPVSPLLAAALHTNAAPALPVVAAATAVAALSDSAVPLCAICEAHDAEVHCASCAKDLCVAGGCDQFIHASSKNAGHVRSAMPHPAATDASAPAAFIDDAAATATATHARPDASTIVSPDPAVAPSPPPEAPMDAAVVPDPTTTKQPDRRADAALRIQATYRGYRGRKTAAGLKSAAAALESAVTAAAASKQEALVPPTTAAVVPDTGASDVDASMGEATPSDALAVAVEAAAVAVEPSPPVAATPAAATPAPTVVPAPTPPAAADAPICEICDDEPATLHCVACDMDVCVVGGCDQSLHSGARTAAHVRRPIGAQPIEPQPEPEPVQPAIVAVNEQPPLTVVAAASSPSNAAGDVDPIGSVVTAVATAPSGPMCEICDEEAASVHCPTCDMDLCTVGGCDKSLHATTKNSKHVRTPIGEAAAAGAAPDVTPTNQTVAESTPPAAAAAAVAVAPTPSSAVVSSATAPDATLCELCEDEPAAVHCDACGMDLCTAGDCDSSLHAPAKMAGHVRVPISAGASDQPATPLPSASFAVETLAEEPVEELEAHTDVEPAATSSPVADIQQPEITPSPLPPASPVDATTWFTEMPAGPTAPPATTTAATAAHPEEPVGEASTPAAGAMCEMCEAQPAVVHCKECDMQLCTGGGCDRDLHTKASNSSHTRTAIGDGPSAAVEEEAPAEAEDAVKDEAITPVEENAEKSTAADVSQEDAPVVEPVASTVLGPSQTADTAAARSAAAVKIQSSFRGYRARKQVRQVRAVPQVVEEAKCAPSASIEMAPPTAIDAPAVERPCDHCKERTAAVWCESCSQALCAPRCDSSVHAMAGNGAHLRVALSGQVAEAATDSPLSTARPSRQRSSGRASGPRFSFDVMATSVTITPPTPVAQAEPALMADSTVELLPTLASATRVPASRPPTTPPRSISPATSATSSPAAPVGAAAAAASASTTAPPMCELCEEFDASVRCHACALSYCSGSGTNQCDKNVHKQTRHSAHIRVDLKQYLAQQAQLQLSPSVLAGALSPLPKVQVAVSPKESSLSPSPSHSHPSSRASSRSSSPASASADRHPHFGSEEALRDASLSPQQQLVLQRRYHMRVASISSIQSEVVAEASDEEETPEDKQTATLPTLVVARTMYCEMCGSEEATVFCDACTMYLCLVDDVDAEGARRQSGCSVFRHSQPNKTAHALQRIIVQDVLVKPPATSSHTSNAVDAPTSSSAAARVCQLCDESPAAFHCASCDMALCDFTDGANGCDRSLHKKPGNEMHVRTPLDAAAAAAAAPSAAATSNNQEHAATRIQAAYRGHASRRRTAALRLERHDAAATGAVTEAERQAAAEEARRREQQEDEQRAQAALAAATALAEAAFAQRESEFERAEMLRRSESVRRAVALETQRRSREKERDSASRLLSPTDDDVGGADEHATTSTNPSASVHAGPNPDVEPEEPYVPSRHELRLSDSESAVFQAMLARKEQAERTAAVAHSAAFLSPHGPLQFPFGLASLGLGVPSTPQSGRASPLTGEESHGRPRSPLHSFGMPSPSNASRITEPTVFVPLPLNLSRHTVSGDSHTFLARDRTREQETHHGGETNGLRVADLDEPHSASALRSSQSFLHQSSQEQQQQQQHQHSSSIDRHNATMPTPSAPRGSLHPSHHRSRSARRTPQKDAGSLAAQLSHLSEEHAALEQRSRAERAHAAQLEAELLALKSSMSSVTAAVTSQSEVQTKYLADLEAKMSMLLLSRTMAAEGDQAAMAAAAAAAAATAAKRTSLGKNQGAEMGASPHPKPSPPRVARPPSRPRSAAASRTRPASASASTSASKSSSSRDEESKRPDFDLRVTMQRPPLSTQQLLDRQSRLDYTDTLARKRASKTHARTARDARDELLPPRPSQTIPDPFHNGLFVQAQPSNVMNRIFAASAAAAATAAAASPSGLSSNGWPESGVFDRAKHHSVFPSDTTVPTRAFAHMDYSPSARDAFAGDADGLPSERLYQPAPLSPHRAAKHKAWMKQQQQQQQRTDPDDRDQPDEASTPVMRPRPPPGSAPTSAAPSQAHRASLQHPAGASSKKPPAAAAPSFHRLRKDDPIARLAQGQSSVARVMSYTPYVRHIAFDIASMRCSAPFSPVVPQRENKALLQKLANPDSLPADQVAARAYIDPLAPYSFERDYPFHLRTTSSAIHTPANARTHRRPASARPASATRPIPPMRPGGSGSGGDAMGASASHAALSRQPHPPTYERQPSHHSTGASASSASAHSAVQLQAQRGPTAPPPMPPTHPLSPQSGQQTARGSVGALNFSLDKAELENLAAGDFSRGSLRLSLSSDLELDSAAPEAKPTNVSATNSAAAATAAAAADKKAKEDAAAKAAKAAEEAARHKAEQEAAKKAAEEKAAAEAAAAKAKAEAEEAARVQAEQAAKEQAEREAREAAEKSEREAKEAAEKAAADERAAKEKAEREEAERQAKVAAEAKATEERAARQAAAEKEAAERARLAAEEAAKPQHPFPVPSLCQMCDELVPEVYCAECKLFMCLEEGDGCAPDMHKLPGKRTHKTVPIAGTSAAPPTPAVTVTVVSPAASPSKPLAVLTTPAALKECEICEDEPAVVHCAACDMDLCTAGGCDADMHRPMSKKNHVRTPLHAAGKLAVPPSPSPTGSASSSAPSPSSAGSVKPDCSLCDDADAVLHCAECNMYLCKENGCDSDLHTGRKAAHVRKPV